MGRHKEVSEDVVTPTEEVVEPVPQVEEIIHLTARYKVVDKDGTKTYPEFKSEGYSPEEVLANLEFPKGVNVLVEVTVVKGEKSYTKALSPARARLILENAQPIKSAETLRNSFRGII